MANAAVLERRVAAALRRAGYSNTGTTLVVGMSGGPDSSALLYALDRLKEAHGLSLHVAHLNHNFRGQEAEDDAAFVAEAARELGLPVTVVKEDPHEYQRQRGISSFEQGAREMRYAFMARVARDAGARAVTVGHTADDLAETVLLHVLRGAGLHGLRGMAEVSDWPWPADAGGLQLFRPLLDVTKDQTAGYCREIGRAYREDSGNYMWRFTRNRVRQDLMPRLEKDYNPQVRNALVRLARTAAETLDFIEGELDRVWDGLMAGPPEGRYRRSSRFHEGVRFSRAALGGLHPALQRLALRRAYILVTGDATRLRESHLVAMEGLVSGQRGGRALELPGGVILRREYGELALTRSRELDCPYPELGGGYSIPLPAEAGIKTVASAGPWQVAMQAGVAGGQPDWAADGDGWTACFDRGALADGIAVRTWRPGDRIQPLGMRGRKKLQDLFTDLRVPRRWRDRVPLVETPRGIAWVVGHRTAEWAKATGEDGAEVLWVRFSLDQDGSI